MQCNTIQYYKIAQYTFQTKTALLGANNDLFWFEMYRLLSYSIVWYCIASYGIFCYLLVLHGIALFRMVSYCVLGFGTQAVSRKTPVNFLFECVFFSIRFSNSFIQIIYTFLFSFDPFRWITHSTLLETFPLTETKSNKLVLWLKTGQTLKHIQKESSGW